METAVWVVTCPETGQFSAVEVRFRSGSSDVQVTDCFNYGVRARCGQPCLRSDLQMRLAAQQGG